VVIKSPRLFPFALVWLGVMPLRAQDVGPPPLASSVRFTPGRLVERVASMLDRKQHYAIYLPSTYRPDRRWPVLLLLDPRGRALLPMHLVRSAAERHGYLVLSSYNTLSDGPNQPNLDAMAAMLTDAQRLLAIDPARFYLVGFSGTARIAWEFAYGLRGHVAGVIGFGAGIPQRFSFPPIEGGGPVPFVYYGGSGVSDFNYEELLLLDQELDRQLVPHRLQFFDGRHSWPPAHVMTDAVDWMTLQAMKRSLAPPDSAWLDSLLAADLARARELEGLGEVYPAFLRYRAIAADFTGLRDVSAVSARAAELGRGPAVRQATRRIREMVDRNHEYLRSLVRFLERFRKAEKPPSLDRSLKELRVAELKRRQADKADTVAALAAGRLLEHVSVYSSFYEPRDYLERKDPVRALAMLAIADAVDPGSPGVCYSRARALSMLGRNEEAVVAVECWAQAVRPSADFVAAEPELAALRDVPQFLALLARLREQRLPPGSREAP
jgi:predicted esterase